MNRDQKKYAFERINLVAKEKGNLAKEKYRIEEKKLPDRERISDTKINNPEDMMSKKETAMLAERGRNENNS